MPVRTTEVATEVLAQPIPNTRTTALAAEVLSQPLPNIRTTELVTEVLVAGAAARTQVVVIG